TARLRVEQMGGNSLLCVVGGGNDSYLAFSARLGPDRHRNIFTNRNCYDDRCGVGVNLGCGQSIQNKNKHCVVERNPADWSACSTAGWRIAPELYVLNRAPLTHERLSVIAQAECQVVWKEQRGGGEPWGSHAAQGPERRASETPKVVTT